MTEMTWPGWPFGLGPRDPTLDPGIFGAYYFPNSYPQIPYLNLEGKGVYFEFSKSLWYLHLSAAKSPTQ